MEDYKYKISLVTPVYNSEEYLEYTLDSVTNQTIGFTDNIQWILVNDGSVDSSASICSEFATKYPNNVVYIEKENGGVSSARNEGVKHIKGQYTIFLDSDDVWDSKAFEVITDFFDEHYDEIDVCTCKLKYIGGFASKEHPQDFKFHEGRKVIDLEEKPKYISTPIGNSVFKSSSLGGNKFDEHMRYCEDTLFLNKILAEKSKVGVIPDAIFYYRKNVGGGNASLTIPETPYWYFDVPETYYMGLIDFSMNKFGKIPLFLQETLIYDIKWRGYTKQVIDAFTEDEKQAHLELMRKVLSYIDDDVILGATGINQYKKLYLMQLKYNKDIMSETAFNNDRFYYEGKQVLSLRGRSMLYIRAFDIKNKKLRMEGVIRAASIGRPYRFEIRDDEGNIYQPIISEYPGGDIKGYIGEIVSKGELFNVSIPVKAGKRLLFYIIFDGNEIAFRPTFDEYIGIERGRRHNFAIKDGFIIKLRKNVLAFYDDTKKNRLKAELMLDQELARKKEPKWAVERIENIRMTRALGTKKLKKQIAFISGRSDGQMMENLNSVYEKVDAPKVSFCSTELFDNREKELAAAKLLYSSKVVVTDDYLSLFRNNNKKDGQYYVQLWHAPGAFKKFGMEASNTTPGMDGMYHRDYDAAIVSSEFVRDIYAEAFQIDKDKTVALGLPRSDKFFDETYLDGTRKKVFERMPEIEGKQLILYAPTFRGKADRRVYIPKIDFAKLNEALSDEQIMVLCPHPLMPPYDGKWNYDKIKMVRDISTNDMMIAADLLVTDYSSVIFEYSLLDKPMVFFCYDYDEYDRDFYLDYDKDLPGEIFKSLDELTEYIKNGQFKTDYKLRDFREKYMAACDGKSSERIANFIKEYLSK